MNWGGGQRLSARWERERKTRDKTGKNGGEASMRKETQTICGHNVENGGALGWGRKNKTLKYSFSSCQLGQYKEKQESREGSARHSGLK